MAWHCLTSQPGLNGEMVDSERETARRKTEGIEAMDSETEVSARCGSQARPPVKARGRRRSQGCKQNAHMRETPVHEAKQWKSGEC